MPTDPKNSQVTILRPADRDGGQALETRSGASMNNRIRHAKLELVSALMRLDALGVDVARIDLAAVLEFGRKLNSF